jgi:hypothetical protein
MAGVLQNGVGDGLVALVKRAMTMPMTALHAGVVKGMAATGKHRPKAIDLVQTLATLAASKRHAGGELTAFKRTHDRFALGGSARRGVAGIRMNQKKLNKYQQRPPRGANC